jgi:multicomponent Na+:H+ antiporter subunit B
MTTDLLLAVMLASVVAAAVATALARSLLHTLVAFAAYSLGLALVWVVLRAPDVALTEAAVGAGVTTALFLLLARRLGDARAAGDGDTVVAPDPARSGRTLGSRAPSLAVAGLVTVGLLLTVPALPAVGDASAPAFGPVTEFYLSDAADRGIDNVVTAVLVVYRGFDTFGEIAVVFAAAVAVLAVLGREVVA